MFVGHDDYAGVDARGRIALALAGAPGSAPPPSRLEKLIAARRAGALGLLIVEDTLPTVAATAAPVALLSGSVTRAGADALLAGAGKTLDGLGRGATGARVELDVELTREQLRAANVIGVLPGADPALAREAVVIGAHYDHLGREGASVYPGADDNASGTALVLGLARSFAAARPPRTLVFILFTGEELGLLGSGHHVGQPSAVPIERMAAMLNFDMVGRLGGRHVFVSGVDTGAGFRALVEAAGRDVGLDLDLRGGGGGASDHSRFHAAGVPVLFFHSGQHADYHQPSDTADKIDVAGMARIADLGARVAARIAEGPRPVFAQGPASRAPLRARRAGRARGRRVPRHRGGRARRLGRRAARLGHPGQRGREGRPARGRRAGASGRHGAERLRGPARAARPPPARRDRAARLPPRRPGSRDLGDARRPAVSLALAVTAASCHLRNLRTRLPFRYGVVTLTHFPLLHLAVDVEAADGRRARGFAADNLPPKWFDKDPAKSFRDNVTDQLASIRAAQAAYLDAGRTPRPVFEVWQEAYAACARGGPALGLNGLTAAFGSSLFERALADAAGPPHRAATWSGCCATTCSGSAPRRCIAS